MMRLILVFLMLTPLAVHADFELALEPIARAQLERIQQDSQQPAENFYTLDYHVSFDIGRDLITERVTRIDRFASADDVQQYGQDSIGFDPHTDTVKIIHAAAISPDGQYIQITDSDLKVLDSSTYDIFSSTKELIVNYRGMQKDGYILLTFERVVNRQQLETDWLEQVLPQTSTPRRRFSLTAKWQGEAPNVSIFSPWASCEQSLQSLVCHGENIPSAQHDERWYWRDEIGYIQFGELTSWQDVQQRVGDYFKTAVDNNGQAWLAKILTGNEQTLEEKIAKVHEFVARDIRYLSRSEYGHAVIPHPTSATFASRQGDCKDKSALLVELLSALGLKPYPVLVHTEKRQVVSERIPSLNQFNHVIVCFELNNLTYCIDATDKHTPWQLHAQWIQGAYALPIKAGSEQPVTLPIDEYTWQRATHTQLTFLPDGGQREVQTRTFKGHYAAWLKGYMNTTETKDVMSWLLEDYQSKVTDFGEPEFEYTGFRDMASDVVIRSQVTLKPFLEVNENLNYTEIHAWLKSELTELPINNKHYGEQIGGVYVTDVVELDLNGLWHIKVLPAKLNFQHKYGSLTRTVKRTQNDQLTLSVTLKIPSRFITIAEKESFNGFLDALYDHLEFSLYGETNAPL